MAMPAIVRVTQVEPEPIRGSASKPRAGINASGTQSIAVLAIVLGEEAPKGGEEVEELMVL